MSDAEAPLINDAITSDDAGFSSDAGNQVVDELNDVMIMPEEGEVSDEGTDTEIQAETVGELKDEISDAIEDGASEEEIKQMVETFKIKVNGKEKEVELDWNNKADIKRRLQLAEAGQSSMQYAKELEKNYEQALQNLKNDPFSVLEELGLNPDELSEARLRNIVEEQKKSPDQREREKLEKDLSQARDELKKQKEEADSARFQQLQSQEAVKLENEIEAALDAHTTLPKSQKTVQRIADAMLWALDNDYDDVTVEDVIPSVEEDIRLELQEFMDSMPVETMESYIGQKNIEKMRKKRLSTASKTNNISNVKPTTESSKEEPKKSSKKQRSKDYFRNL